MVLAQKPYLLWTTVSENTPASWLRKASWWWMNKTLTNLNLNFSSVIQPCLFFTFGVNSAIPCINRFCFSFENQTRNAPIYPHGMNVKGSAIQEGSIFVTIIKLNFWTGGGLIIWFVVGLLVSRQSVFHWIFLVTKYFKYISSMYLRHCCNCL